MSYGTITKPPHPILQQEYYDRADTVAALPCVLEVNQAHVVMLEECGLISTEVAASLLRLTDVLRRDDKLLRAGVSNPEEPRGLHQALEALYRTELGSAGGWLHLARSRNDLQATTARMILRSEVRHLAAQLFLLIHALADAADRLIYVLIAGVTHGQPAQPTTVSHYLSGVGFALVRNADALAQILDGMNRCPMGANAGWGTALGIDPERTAALLGFYAPESHATDAVASYDFATRAVNECAVLATTVSRLAYDLQVWHDKGYLTWPDEWVATSSLMPQKRNAFHCEVVRGYCAEVTGAVSAVLTAQYGVPFTNTIANATVMTQTRAAVEVARRAVRIMYGAVEAFTMSGDKTWPPHSLLATQLANILTERYEVPFRDAHGIVARLSRDGYFDTSNAEDPVRLALRASGWTAAADAFRWESGDTSLRAAVDRARYGGGPGKSQALVLELRGRASMARARYEACDDRLTQGRLWLEESIAHVFYREAET